MSDRKTVKRRKSNMSQVKKNGEAVKCVGVCVRVRRQGGGGRRTSSALLLTRFVRRFFSPSASSYRQPGGVGLGKYSKYIYV